MTWKLWLFGLTKIPAIFFCKPRIIDISSEKLEIKIKLNRRTKNHLSSMYFGILSVGADVTSGFFAMKLIQESNLKISLIFKDFHAEFLKRAEGDVHFVCDEGIEIKKLIKRTKETGVRQNMPVHVNAYVPSISTELVARFILTLSLKKK